MNTKCKPFLRWAGGKNWLVKNFIELLPKTGFSNYHEPFLGGGAFFFHLETENFSFLNDLNSELIDTYECVKYNIKGVIEELEKFKNTKDYYYSIRSKVLKNDIQKAAKFIYLNQTSFNGIYRVNLQGEYNVPYGNRNKDFIQSENLIRVSQKLKSTILSSNDFMDCLENINKGDLVFLDPPYSITQNGNVFLKYNSKMFCDKDQFRLSEMIDCLDEIGAKYILTNSVSPKVREIFFKKGRTFKEFKRSNVVGGKNAKRGKLKELVISNINEE